MSTAALAVAVRPRQARLAGALLLVMAAAAMFAELGVRSRLVVSGDATATATLILGSPHVFRAGFAAYLIAFLCDVPVAISLYVIFRHVNPTLALVATAFRLVYTAVVGAVLLHFFGALLVLRAAAERSGFEATQLHGLAHLSLTLFSHGFSLALVFFGLHLMLLGPLLFRSGQLPRILGVLVGLGGGAYVMNGFALFVAPGIHARVAPLLGMFGLSELALALWLTVKGVTEPPSTGVDARAAGGPIRRHAAADHSR